MKTKELKCGFRTLQEINVDKFSVIYVSTGLHYSADNKKIWNKDLEDHYLDGYRRTYTTGTFFPTKNSGKIRLEVLSLEELYELSKVFQEEGFRIEMNSRRCSNVSRVYVKANEKENIAPSIIGSFELLVYIKNPEQYYKFRTLLLTKIKELGYLTTYIEYPSIGKLMTKNLIA